VNVCPRVRILASRPIPVRSGHNQYLWKGVGRTLRPICSHLLDFDEIMCQISCTSARPSADPWPSRPTFGFSPDRLFA
jgi:hypothetical protein